MSAPPREGRQGQQIGYSFTWVGRYWQCWESIPQQLVKRVAKVSSGRKSSRRASKVAGQLGKQVVLEATVDRDAMQEAMEGATEEELQQLVYEVLPQLLNHYATPETQAYVARRTAARAR